MINIAELITNARGILDEEYPSFFQPYHLLQGINYAQEYAYLFVADATEYFGLKRGTITITQTNVNNGDTTYPLPSRTFYISDYYDEYREEDLRPKLGNTTLRLFLDYSTDGSNIVLKQAPTTPTTLTFHYKSLPPRINEQTGTIDLPDFFFNALLELTVFHCMRRDENIRPEQDGLIKSTLLQLRQTIINLHGKPRTWRVYWNV